MEGERDHDLASRASLPMAHSLGLAGRDHVLCIVAVVGGRGGG